MKFSGDKKYLYWGITAFIVIACSIMFYDFMHNSSSILQFVSVTVTIIKPITYGLIIAYLLTPVLNYISNLLVKLCKKMKWNSESVVAKKRIRITGILLTMALALGLIYGLFAMVIPQLITSITNIAYQLPEYEQNLESMITKLLADNPQIESIINNMLSEYSGELTGFFNKELIPKLNVLIKDFSIGLLGFVKILWNMIIGLIISIYVLGSKELFAAQSKKLIYAIFEQKRANALIDDCRYINKTFGGYIGAKLIDSLIIGLLCFIGTTLLQTPYALLISVIVGVTNIIPFFGPYIGAIPSVLLILMVNPMKAISFTIFVLILQQFDGNVLGPKVLGDSTGLSGFWVIFAITLFGGYWGVLGMAIGVPVFAVIYAWARRQFNAMLTKKNLSTNSYDYLNLAHIIDDKYVEIEPVIIEKTVTENKKVRKTKDSK